jgi:hypothetical protein
MENIYTSIYAKVTLHKQKFSINILAKEGCSPTKTENSTRPKKPTKQKYTKKWQDQLNLWRKGNYVVCTLAHGICSYSCCLSALQDTMTMHNRICRINLEVIQISYQSQSDSNRKC